MTKRTLFIYFAAGLILILAVFTLPFQVGSVRGERPEQQTWPSRTPTPQGGPQPTDPPPPPTTDPGGGGSNPTPQPGPTNTPVNDEAPPTTPAPTVVLATPEGGYNATAEPCGVPPTVQARGLVNVRQGPGLDYDPIASLIFLEVRPIIGRAEFATWWLIQLPGNVTGWVADQAVSVRGYTGLVPIVAPPELDGATPTPGPAWEPTPNPVCTPLPTPTATAETTVEEAEVSTVSIANTAPTEAPPEPTNTPTAEPVVEAAPSDTPQATVTSAVPTATTNVASIDTQQEPTADTGDSDGGSTSASSWILLIGIGLVVVGAASYVLSRR